MVRVQELSDTLTFVSSKPMNILILNRIFNVSSILRISLKCRPTWNSRQDLCYIIEFVSDNYTVSVIKH